MPTTEVNGIELCYERTGPDDGEPLLLVMGLGAQLVDWPDGFCRQLADHGFSVVRFDNRDVGLSSKTRAPLPVFLPPDESGFPALGASAPYTLADMAADAAGLLDALGIERAHVVGASLGGIVAQHLAFDHADRVRTLTSIMSTTGDPHVGHPTPEAQLALMTPPPADREGAVAHGVRSSQAISGPLWDEVTARTRVAAKYDRCFNPVGSAYQLAAAVADGDRTGRLGRITCPTLVVHGAVDPLVNRSGGEATAAAVPGARLLVLDEMGHDLPEPLWPTITGAIAELAGSAKR